MTISLANSPNKFPSTGSTSRRQAGMRTGAVSCIDLPSTTLRRRRSAGSITRCWPPRRSPTCPPAPAVCTVRASRRLLFLVDESLAFYPGLGPPERDVVEQCVARADLVLPVSRRLWDRMAEHCPVLRTRQWQCLRPPVDAETIVQLAAEPQAVVTQRDVPNVLTVGRLSPEKQIPLCVRVHHRLKEAGVCFRWYVIGGGPEEPRVRAEIRDRGMEDDFILLGKQDNVFSILKSCDVFALFSLSEGCPTVVLEALALGVPVIMTDVNGSEEMIDHGTTGLIVANDPDAIASGLARIVQDGGLRQFLRENIARLADRPGANRQGPGLADPDRVSRPACTRTEGHHPDPHL